LWSTWSTWEISPNISPPHAGGDQGRELEDVTKKPKGGLDNEDREGNAHFCVFDRGDAGGYATSFALWIRDRRR
jgi:hypothetical protein